MRAERGQRAGSVAGRPEVVLHQRRALDEDLAGVARGHTNREMAAQLGISPRTVESHRENLMKKLGVRTVAGLTRLALEAGLVPD